MNPIINNDINSLSPTFRKKFDPFRSEVKQKYPTAAVFETIRSQERQNWLYAQGRTRPWTIVTRTKTSNHAKGNAVDIVFTVNGQPKREWPYGDLIEIANRYEIRNLQPKETCHFEDNGKPYNYISEFERQCRSDVLAANSKLYDATLDPVLQTQLHKTSNYIRAK